MVRVCRSLVDLGTGGGREEEWGEGEEDGEEGYMGQNYIGEDLGQWEREDEIERFHCIWLQVSYFIIML